MWKYRNLLKKAGAVVLVLALALTPIGAMAADEETVDGQSAVQQSLEGGTSTGPADPEVTNPDPADKQVQDPAKGPDSGTDIGDGAVAEGSGQQEEKDAALTAQGPQESRIGEAESSGGNTQNAQEEAAEEGLSPMADGQYDVTAPVIESVTFDQNGKTIGQDEELKISVQAYDAESGISYIEVGLQFQDSDDSNSYSDSITLTQSSANSKVYEGTYPMKGMIYSEGRISYIKAVDNRENPASYPVWDSATNVSKYTFKVDPVSIEDIKVTDVDFSNPGSTLKSGESAEFTFKATPAMEDGDGTFYVRFKYEDPEYNTSYLAGAWYDAEAGLYRGSLSADDWMEAGKWKAVAIEYEILNKTVTLLSEEIGDIWYQIEDTKGDKIPPEITSIQVGEGNSQNGKMLQPGDVVNFKIQAKDDVELDTYSAYLYLYPVAEIDTTSTFVELVYNNGVFEGTFEVTDDTYPCEWYIGDISIQDMAGNDADDSTLGYPNYPYYFTVKNGDTFVNPAYEFNYSFNYLNAEGEWESVNAGRKENVERRTTLGELGIEFPEVPEYPGLTFQGWTDYEGNPVDENTQIVNNSYMPCFASYDKAPVTGHYLYYDENGYRVFENTITLVPKDTLRKDVIAEARKKASPGDVVGLTFKEWNIYEYDTDMPVGERYDLMEIQAVYDKNLVRFLIHDSQKDSASYVTLDMEKEYEMILCQPVSEGDIVKIPTSTDTYDTLTWTIGLTQEEKDAGEIVSTAYDRTVYGYAGEGSNNGGGPTDQDPSVTQPGIGLPEDAIKQIVESIGNLTEGQAMDIDMGDATVVPKEVLEAAKGKNITLNLNMNGYTWTINGQDILDDNLLDINLEVKFNTDAIPSKTVQELAGDNPTQQLSLTHEGSFGFKATLTMNAGAEYAGKNGNLYWYDSNHRMIFVDAGEIQPDGAVSLEFSHASDYVLVMADEVMGGGTGETDSAGNAKNVNTTATTAKAGQTVQSVKTGDTASFALLLTALGVSALAAGIVVYRRKLN